MNELRRMAYLEALGVDSYVSRTQLPGAALTRRLAMVTARAMVEPCGASDAPRVPVTTAPPQRRTAGARAGFDPTAPIEPAVATAPLAREPGSRDAPVPRFSLTAIIAGDWLWLEELAGMPLTTEQVQLVQSMALALLHNREPRAEPAAAAARAESTRADVAQFDWPIHTNSQLDLGTEAARASVAGFVGRRLEQHGCRGLVLLGQSCALRLPLEELKILTVTTASSAQILSQPLLKRTVWRDLQPLVRML